MKVWIKRIFIGLGVLLLLGVLYAAFVPLPPAVELPEEKWGAGSSSVEPAWSGLQRDFPASNETADNPSTPQSFWETSIIFASGFLRRVSKTFRISSRVMSSFVRQS